MNVCDSCGDECENLFRYKGLNWLPETTTHQTTFRDKLTFEIGKTAHGKKQLIVCIQKSK